jgi:hypothetical protein
MNDGQVRGMVHLIEGTKTFGQKGFRKRLVVLEQDKGRFTNYVPLEFIQESCDAVDELKVGDEVEVTFRLNGRKWQRDSGSEVKYFLNAEALGFQIVGKGTEDSADRINQQLSETGDEDSDVPF